MSDIALDVTTPDKKEHNPPYVAYRTFSNFVESLRVAMPSRIDRSVMHTMSGAAQSHIMAALKSMGLVSKQGIPAEEFKTLVQSEGDQRKASLLAAIRVGFPFLFDGSIDLPTATGKQLLEKFDQTPLTGNTLRRSVAFFLAAAKDAGLELSPYFNKIQARSGTSKRNANSANSAKVPNPAGAIEPEADAEDNTDDELKPPPVQPHAAESLTVNLKSGGTVTLLASTSFLKMSTEDRAFVFDIIDRLQKYGAAT